MKISYNWLKNYVNLDDITPEQLADKLTTAGLEIEDVYHYVQGTNLTIGEVLTCENHPDSDHLHVCTVNIGDAVNQIVCGAPNVKAGIKVIVAKPGAVLPEITIKASKVRGVESNGMICALFELGVDKKNLRQDQIDGIEILGDDAIVGEDPIKYLGLDDVILDGSPTPNRPDLLSMWGVAKEVGAVLKREVNLPKGIDSTTVGTKSNFHIESQTDKCPYFLGKVVNKVVVKPSPKWMSDQLHAAGIKSINNVVDISNYVMLETGQPLHFYNLSKLSHQDITVKDNIEMTMTALDGVEYQVYKDDIVITTNGVPTGLAGIMGGDDSKIDEETTSIFIEAAHFNDVSIRNTSRRLGLATEAASRFIKGVEPLAAIKAVDRCVELLSAYAEADGFEENVEAGTNNYQDVVVTETLEHCNMLLGTNFTSEQVKEVLEALDFNVTCENDTFTCKIPSYRTDIKIREDIDEEVIRLIGFDNLGETLPHMSATVGALNPRQRLRRTLRNLLGGFGLNEIVTYTLTKEDYMQDTIMPFGEYVQVMSPLSEDRRYIRNSLMASVLTAVAYNQNRQAANINVYEISTVSSKDSVEERLAICLYGNLQANKLQKVNVNSDFYTLKGIILDILEKHGFNESRIKITENNIDTTHFHPYKSACVYVGKDLLGIFGDVHPTYAKKMGVDKCVYAELKLEVLLNNKVSKVRFVPLDKYPSVSRDISLVVKEDVNAQQLIETIKRNGKELVRNVDVFDIYQGEHVEKGYKSVALNIIYQSADHTLKDDEINACHNKILESLKNKLDATLRG